MASSAHASSSSATQEAEELLGVADWAAHKQFADILRDVVIKIKDMNIPLPEDLQSRIEFFGIKQMAVILNPSEEGSLAQFLSLFDELTNKWQDKLEQVSKTPTLQWTTMRYKIATQMGLGILRRHLDLIDTEAFSRPDTIKLPAKHDQKKYLEELDELFLNNRFYPKRNTVAAKTEKAIADSAKAALLNIYTDDKIPKLFNYKIFSLFNSNTMTTLSRDICGFIEDVENAVLPRPAMSLSLITNARAAAAAVVPAPSKDWTVEQRDELGPYGAQGASLKQPQATTSASPHKPPPANQPSQPAKKKNGAAPVTEAFTQLSDSEDAEPHQKASSRTRGGRSKAPNREPITEAFTQMSDEEWEKPSAKRTKVQEDKNTVVGTNVAEDLATARRTFSEKQAAKDPLLAALGESPPRVISKAGARAAEAAEWHKAPPSAPLPSPEATWQRRAPKRGEPVVEVVKSPKKTIIASRPTAQTVNFSDSEIETASESTPQYTDTKSRFALVTLPKANFPKSIKSEKPAAATAVFAGPKQRVAWNIEEEQALIRGVTRYGEGKWKEILSDPELGPVFRERSNVQLKDKFRNMVSAGYNFSEA